MKRRFGELPIGARFCYRAHRYEKVGHSVGRHEENGGSVFHASTEVVALTLGPPSVRSEPRIAPLAPPTVWKEPRDRLPSEEQRAVALELLRRLCPPYQPVPDGWHGTYSDEHNSKEGKNYGTGI